ncbi:hypothetical protein CL653_03800 [bacterium]|nr:hypothetical protein [bacterium]
MFYAILTSVAVALTSLIGVLFFGDSRRLAGIQKFVVPVAVGIFLSLVLFELIPETLALNPSYGGIAVAFGFIGFYILASVLHQRFHHLEEEDCDRKGAAMLLLVGDAVHNIADGVILGGAFLIDPTVGLVTAVGLAIHEIPQEIVEFGVLVRAGFSRIHAAMYNLLSASSIVFGTVATMLLANTNFEYLWIITGIAAGNLLYLAASDLLPRIHGNLPHYKSIWHSASAIIIGFVVMTFILNWTHSNFGHGHDLEDEHVKELLNEHDEGEYHPH